MNDENTKEGEDINKMNTIRTLESDLASVIRDKNYGKNIVKIITDPNNKKDDYTDTENRNIGFFKNKLLLFLGFIVIILIIAYFVYFKYIQNSQIEPETDVIATTTEINVIKIDNILKPEVIQNSDFSKLNRFEIISEVSRIKNFFIVEKIQPSNNIGINTNLDTYNFFQKIRYSGNDSFLRSLNNNEYAFGLYSIKDNKFETYLLIKVENFDLSFKSILEWEKYMPDDLKDIFSGNNIITSNQTNTSTTSVSTSTVTSSVSTTSTVIKYAKQNTNKIFVDRILKNYDIREYVDNENNINLIYGFINNKYLLITSGESSFIDIKDKLLKENIVR